MVVTETSVDRVEFSVVTAPYMYQQTFGAFGIFGHRILKADNIRIQSRFRRQFFVLCAKN